MQAASGLPLNASSLNSTLNATQTLLASSASAAAALLSNSSLLGTAANQTGNITQLAAQHASAGMLLHHALSPACDSFYACALQWWLCSEGELHMYVWRCFIGLY